MEAMDVMEDKQFDLAIVDPPYGINESGQTNHTRSKLAKAKKYIGKNWDKDSPDFQYFRLLFSKSCNQVVWGANHFIHKMPYDSSSWVVWDKENKSNHFADCELAWTSFDKSVRLFRYRWAGMLQGNMKAKEIRIHPTQKPVALYKWLLKKYAKHNDEILDTHGGSMSLAIACWDLGFNFTCYEIDKDYYTSAVQRFERHIKQEQLFQPSEFHPKQRNIF